MKEYALWVKMNIPPAFDRVDVLPEDGFRIIFECEGCGKERSRRGTVLKAGKPGPQFKCRKNCRGGGASVIRARQVQFNQYAEGQYTLFMTMSCDNYVPETFVNPTHWNAYLPGVEQPIVIPNGVDAHVDGVQAAVRIEMSEHCFRRNN